MRKVLILLVLFFISPLLIKYLGADMAGEINVSDLSEDIVESEMKENAEAQINDIESIHNPFIPQLPKTDETVETLPPITTIPVAVDLPPPPIAEVLQPIEPDSEIPPPPPPPTVTILGLIWNTERPQAIISGSQGNQILDVGDRIKDWQVQSINQFGIELAGYGQTVFIFSGFNSEKVLKN